MSEDLSKHWALDERVAFLNHGSFGACPLPVLAEQTRYRAQLEAEPVRFFLRELPPLLDAVRERLGAFLGCDPEGLALTPNATTGVNTVLASLELSAGDELLVSDHEYNACRNALDAVALRSGAKVVVAKLPFPLSDPQQVVDAFLEPLSERTAFALLDHITSPTGLILPLEEIARALSERGVPLLVDGAHAPGMIPLDLQKLGQAGVHWYTGNFHKWLCTPKGSAFLWVRPDERERIRPLNISHGANTNTDLRSRFRLEFDWTGTGDPTPFLAIPAALDFFGGLVEGGWEGVRSRNRDLVLEGRRLLLDALGLPEPAPASMIGSLAAIPIAPGPPIPRTKPNFVDPLHDVLLDEHGIEVPIMHWPVPGSRLLRISAQLYNRREQYARLAAVLPGLL